MHARRGKKGQAARFRAAGEDVEVGRRHAGVTRDATGAPTSVPPTSAQPEPAPSTSARIKSHPTLTSAPAAPPRSPTPRHLPESPPPGDPRRRCLLCMLPATPSLERANRGHGEDPLAKTKPSLPSAPPGTLGNHHAIHSRRRRPPSPPSPVSPNPVSQHPTSAPGSGSNGPGEIEPSQAGIKPQLKPEPSHSPSLATRNSPPRQIPVRANPFAPLVTAWSNPNQN